MHHHLREDVYMCIYRSVIAFAHTDRYMCSMLYHTVENLGKSEF